MPEDIHWQKYAARFKTQPALTESAADAAMAVCIPVYAEPHVLDTLESLYLCDLPQEKVDIFLLFNRSERMSPTETFVHEEGWRATLDWIKSHIKEGISFIPLYVAVMPDPSGGVGWARKLVMDEAARRLDQEGVLLCLDADCTVDKNYLIAVHDYFSNHKDCDAASVYFAHPLDEISDDQRKAIVLYELHLRYLVHALRWAGHPFAYHTVGSAMAVRRSAYLRQGGMNTRKAGEDFYFLQKFIEIGSLHEIKNTTVYPSVRVSSRVPFGTGKAMASILLEHKAWLTTSPAIYRELKTLLANLAQLYPLPDDKTSLSMDALISSALSPQLNAYLQSVDFISECVAIGRQTASITSFIRRFFRYFNAFRVIKYTHWMRDQYYPDVPVAEAAQTLASLLQVEVTESMDAEGYLELFRQLDRK